MASFNRTINCRFMLLASCGLLLLILMELGGTSSGKQINCRKYVLAPECRGIAAKRDTTRLNTEDNNRYYPEDRESNNDQEKPFSTNISSNKYSLGELFKRMMERNADYDTSSNSNNNYLK